jgi:hypothetical protein
MNRFDNLAWEQIHKRPGSKSSNRGLKRSGRPCNFAEVQELLQAGEDFRIAFPMFLDEFFLFKTADFLDSEPTDYFDVATKAWLAGVVEYLAHRFALEVPEWAEKPEYFLSEQWKMSHDDAGEPEFRRRNVQYNPRHLIRL